MTARPQEKTKVHAQRTANLAPKLWTKYNMMIDVKGVIEAIAVPKILITRIICVSDSENKLVSVVGSSGSVRTGF